MARRPLVQLITIMSGHDDVFGDNTWHVSKLQTYSVVRDVQNVCCSFLQSFCPSRLYACILWTSLYDSLCVYYYDSVGVCQICYNGIIAVVTVLVLLLLLLLLLLASLLMILLKSIANIQYRY